MQSFIDSSSPKSTRITAIPFEKTPKISPIMSMTTSIPLGKNNSKLGANHQNNVIKLSSSPTAAVIKNISVKDLNLIPLPRLFMDSMFYTWLGMDETIQNLKIECEKGSKSPQLISSSLSGEISILSKSQSMEYSISGDSLNMSSEPPYISDSNQPLFDGQISFQTPSGESLPSPTLGLRSMSDPAGLSNGSASGVPPISPKFKSKKIPSLSPKNEDTIMTDDLNMKTSKSMGSLMLGITTVEDDEFVKKSDSAAAATSCMDIDSAVNISSQISQTASIGSSLNDDTLLQLDSANNSAYSLANVTDPKDHSKGIPAFYFPFGRPLSKVEERRKRHSILNNVREAFGTDPEIGISESEFVNVTKACGLPRYLNTAFFRKIDTKDRKKVSFSQFSKYWKYICQNFFDEASMVFGILKQDENVKFLVAEDFLPLLEDVVLHHPGLSFLSSLPLFQERYVETVICRIFYSMNRYWTGKISLSEFRRHRFLSVLKALEETEDINLCREFFSYKHFYVIYCKFWELDTDHDLTIDLDSLMRYENYSLSSRVVQRIMMGCGLGKSKTTKSMADFRMTYRDFIWFMISEEDKGSATSIDYWFRCLDLDGDGVVSIYEMQYFFEEQMERMDKMVSEPIKFEDCLCQILDMIQLKDSVAVTVADLKKCRQAGAFFDMFFNLGKFLAFEQHASQWSMEDEEEESESQEGENSDGSILNGSVKSGRNDRTNGFSRKLSRWDRYAEAEYEQMAMEEEDGGDDDDDDGDGDENRDRASISLDDSFNALAQNAKDAASFLNFNGNMNDMGLEGLEYFNNHPRSSSKGGLMLEADEELEDFDNHRKGLQVNRHFS